MGLLLPNLAAAIAHIPGRADAIEAYASRDVNFYGLCVDLADAEREAARWRASSGLLAEKRCAEYEVLVKELAEEIELLLNSMATIAFELSPRK